MISICMSLYNKDIYNPFSYYINYLNQITHGIVKI